MRNETTNEDKKEKYFLKTDKWFLLNFAVSTDFFTAVTSPNNILKLNSLISIYIFVTQFRFFNYY